MDWTELAELCADAYRAQRAEEETIKGYEPECMRPLNTDRKPRKN